MPSYKSISGTLGTLLANGEQPVSIVPNSAPAAATAAHAVVADSMVDAAILAEASGVEAAVQVLEADGALPTQAHVTDLRNAWNLMLVELGEIATATQAVVTDTTGFVARDVTLMFDASAVVTRSRLKQAIDQLLAGVQSGHGGLTP